MSIKEVIDLAWESRAEISALNAPEVREAVEQVIADLNGGRLRVAERRGVGDWVLHQWIKKAVLLSFRLNDNKLMHAGELGFFDKVPTKFSHLDEAQMKASGVLVRMALWVILAVMISSRWRARREQSRIKPLKARPSQPGPCKSQ